MKIIPYSVLAATLLSGTAAGPAAPKMNSLGAAVEAQEETKAKSGLGAGATAQDLGALPVGTTICAELDKSIDAKKAKPGNEIVARTTLAVLWRGQVAIPNEAKIVGHVTEVAVLPGGDGKSRVGILFDHVVMKDGTAVPIALTVQAIGKQPVAPNDLEVEDPANSEIRPPMYHPSGIQGTATPSNPPAGRVRQGPEQTSHEKSTPVLDAGSHGVIGIPDVSLTEAKDAGQASVIESAKRSVKIESETEIVLRVIGAEGGKAGKP